MFNTLNDDCWLNILKYVDLKDQLTLSRISESLQSNVEYHWKHLRHANMDNSVMTYFEQNPNEMHQFLKLASESLESLVLKRSGGSMLRLESWKSYSFPKLHSLNCQLWYMDEVAEADKETLLMTQLFPELTKLTLQSSTSGRHLWCWRKLQELHLLVCDSLDTSTFHRIFHTLPLREFTLLYYGYNVCFDEGILPASTCVTLEKLVIDDHHLLGGFLENLLRLPRFRSLAFFTRVYYEGLLQTVANVQPLKVYALLFNDAFWGSSRVCDVILRMPNLHRLALQEDDIETMQLYQICSSLSHLEELHLMKMRSLPTPTQLWEMVDACKSLKVLNLSSCKLDKQFLELSAPCIKRVLSKRSLPITVHLHNTIAEHKAQETLKALNHPNLTISFEAAHVNIWSSRFLEIEFNQSLAA